MATLLFPELQCLTPQDIANMTPEEKADLTVRGIIQIANYLDKLNGKVTRHEDDLNTIKQDKAIEQAVKAALEHDRVERKKLEEEQEEDCEKEAAAKESKGKVRFYIPNWLIYVIVAVGGVLVMIGWAVGKVGIDFLK